MAVPGSILDGSIPPWKQVVLLSWPTIVELLLQTAVNYVDTAMVGSIGVDATAAVGVTMSTIWLINGFMNAVGVGYSVLVAHSIGEGNFDQAKKIIRQSVLATVVVGLLLTALVTLVVAPWLPVWMHADPVVIPMARSYLQIIGMAYLFNVSLIVCSSILRCAGDTKTPMKFNIMTNLINVVGNYFLIYPTTQMTLFGHSFTLHRAGWGVSGAAAATAASIVFSGVSLMAVLFLRPAAYRIGLKEGFCPDRKIIKRAIALGTPAAMERVTISLGQIAATAMITGLGTMALSANLLADTGEKLCYLPVYGFATAGTTLVAQSLGAGKRELAVRYGRWCNRLGIGVMLVTSTIMFLCAAPIIGFFTDDGPTILLAAKMLRIEAFAEPFLAVGVVLAGVLRGVRDTRWPFYISLAGMWVVRIPLSYVLIHVFGWGLEAIWGAMIIDWLVRAVLSYTRFCWQSRRWQQMGESGERVRS